MYGYFFIEDVRELTVPWPSKSFLQAYSVYFSTGTKFTVTLQKIYILLYFQNGFQKSWDQSKHPYPQVTCNYFLTQKQMRKRNVIIYVGPAAQALPSN